MKKRIFWLDNLKGFLIFIVVLGHTILFTNTDGDSNLIYRYISSFWMALFMFSSGFASYRPIPDLDVIPRRFKQLVIPFVVWSLILCFINGHLQVWEYFIYPTKSVWFLWALFCINSLVILCCNIARKYNCVEELVCICVIVVLLLSSKLISSDLFSFKLICLHIVNFSIGYFSRKYFDQIINFPKALWYIGSFLFIIDII